MTPKQQEAIDALHEHGSIKRAAEALGISRASLHKRLEAAGLSDDDRFGMLRGMASKVAATRRPGIDPAIAEGMDALGMEVEPIEGWIKTKPTADGPGYSFRVRPVPMQPSEIADRIAARFEALRPADPIVAPEDVLADLCSFYVLTDVHLGMRAWGEETGGDDYDLPLAVRDIRFAFEKVVARTPRASKAVLLINGDFFHADDNSALTPKHKHRLDVSERFGAVIEAGVEIVAEVIARLLEHHADLEIAVLPGNHDPHATLALRLALGQRYRLEPRVTVLETRRGLLMFRWGSTGVFAHHGDEIKPERFALLVSGICPFWSDVAHRYAITGHVHHDKARDVGPLRWESLRAFCPPDAHAAALGFSQVRALQSLTFDVVDGLVNRALDPIKRRH